MSDGGAIRAGKAFVAFFAKDEMKAGLDKIKSKVGAWGKSIAAMGGTLAAGSAGVTGAMSAMAASLMGPVKELTHMSERTGIAAEALSELTGVAAKGGAEAEDFERAIGLMQKGIGEGSAKMQMGLGKIGLSIGQLAALNPEQQFLAIADGFAGLTDPAAKAAVSMEIFGRGGRALIPMLAKGADGINQMREKMRLMGTSLSESDIKKVDDFRKAFGWFGKTMQAIKNQIGVAVAPMLQSWFETLSKGTEIVARFVKQNHALVKTLFTVALVVGAVGSVLVTLGGALISIGSALAFIPVAFGGFVTAISGIGAAVAAAFSPIGLTIAAVVVVVTALAAGLAFLGYTFLTSTTLGKAAVSGLAASFFSLLEVVKGVFQGIYDAMVAGNMQLAGKVMMAALNLAWAAGVVGLKNLWEGFTNWLRMGLLEGIKWAMQSALQAVGVALTEMMTAVLAKVNWLRNQVGLKGIKMASGAAKGGGLAGIGTAFLNADANYEKAKAALDAAIKEAADARAATEGGAKLPGKPIIPPMGEVAEMLKASAAGTFSGFAASLLGRSGESAMEKIANKQLKVQEEMRDELKGMDGMMFAE